MSKNITVAQLEGNNKAYGIDEFRNMVNYTSGTNKGYVRFQLASEGLKLQKIDNKIDFPLSWRSTMSANHNKALRSKFLAAMENGLRHIGDTANAMGNIVLTPKKLGVTL